MVSYSFVFITVFSTVVSQVLFKYGVKSLQGLGVSAYSLTTLINPFILGGLFFSVLSIVAWMVALSRLNLSTAYPFMSLTFPLVLICSIFFFNEPVSLMRWTGVALIMAGLFVIGRYA